MRKKVREWKGPVTAQNTTLQQMLLSITSYSGGRENKIFFIRRLLEAFNRNS